jgi:PAS domain S-box-containing protein
MNNRRLCPWLELGLWLVLAPAGVLAAQPAVRVGLYQNLPKAGWSEAGKPEGLFVDILEAIAVEEGWTIDYVPGTWAEGLARLERGEIDLMPDVALNDERQALYAFHAEPVLSSWFHIYARHGGDIRSLLDLDGKRIALLEGSIQQSALEKMVREFDLTAPLLTFADYDAAFAAVIAGRADAVVANRFYSTAHLRDDPIEDTGIIFHPTRLFFAASRSGDPALLEAIDRHLARMKPDPASAYYRSFRRWTSEEMPARIPVWLKLVALAALLGLALALGWNFALNRRVEARTRQFSDSERRFTELFNANPSGLLLVERNSRLIAQVNPAAAAMIGLPPEQIVGKKCHGFMCPAEETACPVCDLGQTVDRSERVLIDARGISHPILKSVVPLQLNGTDYLLESFVDISELKQTREALQKSEQQLREAQHIAGVGSYVLDIPSGAWTASDELHAILGMDPAAPHTVETWENLLHPDDRDAMSAYFREDVIGQGLPFHREYRIVRAGSGEERWVLGIGRLEFSPEGRPVRMIGTIQDITERKNSEAEQERLAEELQQSRKLESIGRLAGGVAHDFNNMLQIISGNAELALADISPGDGANAARDCVRDVLKASERSAQLVSQLLAFARKQTIMPRTLDLNEAVESTLKMLQRLIGEQIELAWRPAAALWPVKADPVQIDQILTNVCLNARDAMPHGGQITIETANISFDDAFCARHSYYRPGDYVMLAIGDSGTGMDKETLRLLFEPFFTTKTLGQGTGLGLATVYGIVKQNHGFIDVYSEPDRGSCFKIYLPRHPEAAAQPIPLAAPSPACGGGKTILLVEDDPAILDITRTLIEKIGCRVLPALTPGEALHLADEHPGDFHLLMTDVVMPGMTGRDLAKNIQKMHPGIPCLFMSGYTANVIAHHGVLDPGVHFIQKPFGMEALAAKLREALDA